LPLARKLNVLKCTPRFLACLRLAFQSPRDVLQDAHGAWIIGTVHDEIILEVPNEMPNDAAEILRATMIEAGKAFLAGVPVEVEVTIADTRAEK
jgi:DNA polymerase I-like protein with 3'-5' exonuclease and polymerase domains